MPLAGEVPEGGRGGNSFASLREAEAMWQSILLLLGFTQPTVFNCEICSGLLRAEWIFTRNDARLVGLLHT